MSLKSLENDNLPSVLVQKIRPMWVTRPNDIFLLKIYLEAKTYSYQKISEFLAFCSWVQHGEEYQKSMIDWVRKQSDKSYFKLNNIMVRMIENGYLSKLKEVLVTQESMTSNCSPLSNIARNEAVNLDDQISFVSYAGILIYGNKNSGKTFEVQRILQKYQYLYLDMRLYQDKLLTVDHLVTSFGIITPKPLFLLVRGGIQYYSTLQGLSDWNCRVVFI